MSAEPPPTEPDAGPRRSRRPMPGQGWPRWGTWLVLGLIAALFVVASLFTTSSGTKITYSQFLDRVREKRVESVSIDNSNHDIAGTDKDGTRFKVSGPESLPDEDLALLERSDVRYDLSLIHI